MVLWSELQVSELFSALNVGYMLDLTCCFLAQGGFNCLKTETRLSLKLVKQYQHWIGFVFCSTPFKPVCGSPFGSP